MAEESAASAVLEALLAIHSADWVVQQLGDNRWTVNSELVVLGLIQEDSTETGSVEEPEEGEVSDEGDDATPEPVSSSAPAGACSFVNGGEPMDEEE